MFLRNKYFGSQPFFMSSCYTKTFLHLIIIAAVSNFTVLNFIGWYPANIYLLKVNSRNTRKRREICSKLTIKTVQCRSGIFIVNF